jgi:SAM-dependent methyltransferase
MAYPNDIVTEASKYLLGKGITVLQGFRLADTEERHVGRLASYMELNGEREVADMGCGFGAVSRFLHRGALKDAHFWLVNRNEFQLKYCPMGSAFTRCLEDMCATSIPDGVVDLVMFNYSLCHVEQLAALTEAARIARPGTGKLFVYDYARVSGDDSVTEKILAAKFLSDPTFKVLCDATGWRDVETFMVDGDDTLFREAVNDDALYDEMFDDLRPVIWRAHR